jgi:hypothetical protein
MPGAVVHEAKGLVDECQILYIWTPYFAFVKPLASLFSNAFG